MTDLIKVYAIDANKMGDDFKCLTCSDDDYENFIIRFI